MLDWAIVAAVLALAPPVAAPAPITPAPPPAAATPPSVPGPEAPPALRGPDVPATVTLSADGRSILLDGPIGRGTAERFIAVAQSAPNARTVMLLSPGGWIYEAERVAGMVRARRFDTYVETTCLSACTMILLSGRDRAVSPGARIGFHAPILLGGRQPDAAYLRSTRAFFDSRGVAPAFTDRVFATPNEAMWYPTYDEMLAAGVVTRRTLGGETQALFSRFDGPDALRAALRTVGYWRALEARYPDVAERVIAANIAARARGGNDGDVATAMRTALIDAMPMIFAGAPPEVIDQMLDLSIAEAEAARAVSYTACDELARGRLNILSVLGPELALREQDLMQRAIEASGPAVAFDRDRALALFAVIMDALPAEQADAMAALEDPSAAAASPELVCEASLAMFRAVAALPPANRQLVARFLFTVTE